MEQYSLEYAQSLDAQDSLKEFRGKFVNGEEDLIYLDGNSLGKLPKSVPAALSEVVEQEWGQRLIRSWNEGWYMKATELGNQLAPIIGAQSGEVILSDSTSNNLYKLAGAALGFQKGRKKIISDDLNFPTDLYLLQGLAHTLNQGHRVQLAHSEDGKTINLETLEHLIDEDTALVCLSHVVFKSAFKYDIKAVTELAHSKGALVLWDLSHSVGAVPVELTEWGVDLAVGCTYKYLNGGPGAPAFLYVREGLAGQLTSPIWGWFGDAKPFQFNLNFQPASDIRKFLVGTPPMLSLSALEHGLRITNQAGMPAISQKSKVQSEYLLTLYKKWLEPLDFQLGSPSDPDKRGSHISLKHPEAYRICKALISEEIGNHTVIPDFRAPDNIRLGIAPLYNSFEDIYHAISQIKTIVNNQLYQQFSLEKTTVT